MDAIEEKPKRVLTCTTCGKPGHYAPRCPDKPDDIDLTDPIDEAARLRQRIDALEDDIGRYLKIRSHTNDLLDHARDELAKLRSDLAANRAARVA